jgi:hypothetical protein
MNNPFSTPNRVFYNTSQANNIEMQVRNLRPNNDVPYMRLGNIIPYPQTNQFDQLYGHSWNLQTPAENLRAPIEADAAFWSQRTIPYTILMTNNKAVDVAGTVYLNKDLPVKPQRM